MNPWPPKRPARSPGLQLLAQQAREVGEEVLGHEDAEFLVQGVVLVGLDVGHAPHAALGRLREAHPQLLDEVAPVQEAGRGIALQRFLELALVLARVRDPGRHDDLHAGVAVELGAHQLELERRVMPAHDEGRGMQRVARPLALHARDQRALDGGVVVRIEGVHQRRADDLLGFRVAEKREPRRVRVDDNAFLYQGNRVGRALDDVLQLLLGLARRGERGGERAVEAVGAKLAPDDELQPRDVAERDRVLSAERERLGDHGLVHFLAHDHHRDVRGEAGAKVHRAREVDDALVGEQHEHLGGSLGQGVAQVACVRQPGDVHRVAGVAQCLVDRLDIVLTARERNHRDRGNGLQVRLRRRPARDGRRIVTP